MKSRYGPLLAAAFFAVTVSVPFGLVGPSPALARANGLDIAKSLELECSLNRHGAVNVVEIFNGDRAIRAPIAGSIDALALTRGLTQASNNGSQNASTAQRAGLEVTGSGARTSSKTHSDAGTLAGAQSSSGTGG